MSNAKTISGHISFMFILVGLLAGCAVGPDFKRPSTPDVTVYTATPVPSLTNSATTELGESQRLVEGRWSTPMVARIWLSQAGYPRH